MLNQRAITVNKKNPIVWSMKNYLNKYICSKNRVYKRIFCFASPSMSDEAEYREIAFHKEYAVRIKTICFAISGLLLVICIPALVIQYNKINLSSPATKNLSALNESSDDITQQSWTDTDIVTSKTNITTTNMDITSCFAQNHTVLNESADDFNTLPQSWTDTFKLRCTQTDSL